MADRDDFRARLINYHMRYFRDDTSGSGGVVGGISATEQVPYDSINYSAGGVATINKWTQPTLWGFYAHILANAARGRISSMTVSTALTKLKTLVDTIYTQITTNGWVHNSGTPTVRSLLSWFDWHVSSTLGPVSSPSVGCIDNIEMAIDLACTVGALEGGSFSGQDATDAAYIISKIVDSGKILDLMGPGFTKFFDSGANEFYMTTPLSNNTTPFTGHLDRLTSEGRSANAFVSSYYGITTTGFTTLANATATKNYTDSQAVSIPMKAPWDGGGFQYFWNLLRCNEHNYTQINPTIRNFFYGVIDWMKRNNYTGIPSATDIPNNANYYGEVGINEMSERANTANDYCCYNVNNVAALVPAYVLNNNLVLDILYQMEVQCPNVRGPLGYWDAVVSNTEVCTKYVGIDQAAIVLGLIGEGGNNLATFMNNRTTKKTAFEALYTGLSLGITLTSQTLPTTFTFLKQSYSFISGPSAQGIVGTYPAVTPTPRGFRFNYSGQSIAGGRYFQCASPYYPATGHTLRFVYRVTTTPNQVKIEAKNGSDAVIGSYTFTLTAGGPNTADIALSSFTGGTGDWSRVKQLSIIVDPASFSNATADFYVHELTFRRAT